MELAAADGDMAPVVAHLDDLEAAFAAAVEELESIERGITNES
jgi:hypothetical protein